MGTGEGMIPHVGVHGRTVQERPTRVPRSNNARLGINTGRKINAGSGGGGGGGGFKQR